MSKKENKTISERVKLWIANKALRIAESMLAKERPAHIDPDKPNKKKSKHPILLIQLNVPLTDHDFSERGEEKGEQDMKEFYPRYVSNGGFPFRKEKCFNSSRSFNGSCS